MTDSSALSLVQVLHYKFKGSIHSVAKLGLWAVDSAAEEGTLSEAASVSAKARIREVESKYTNVIDLRVDEFANFRRTEP